MHGLAQTISMPTGGKVQFQHTHHIGPKTFGYHGIDSSIADHGYLAIGHGEIDQYAISITGPMHAEFLEDEGCAVQRIILDVIFQMHTDLTRRALFRIADRPLDTVAFNVGQEILCGKNAH